MSHEIYKNLDRVVLHKDRGQAWHGLGLLMDGNLTAVEAGEKYGYFWTPETWQLQAVSPSGLVIPVDSHRATVRTQDNDGNAIAHLLGVVGEDYKVCPNRELAEFVDALAVDGRVIVETIGTIRGGKRFWILARGESFLVGGTDEVTAYILASMGHDGSLSIRLTPTSVRTVCSNTFHLVVPRKDDLFERPEEAAIVIQHRGKIKDKLGEARQALLHYGEIVKRNRELFEAMHAKKFSRDEAVKLFAGVYAANWEAATPDELASADKKVRTTAEQRMARMEKASEAFLARYDSEQQIAGGDNLWAAFNAASGFIQHDKVARGKDDSDRVARRVESNLFGINASRTHNALAHALALAS